MSRFADARRGWPKPPPSSKPRRKVYEHEARAAMDEVEAYFHKGHPANKISCQRRDAIFAEAGGRSIDTAIAALEVTLIEGAKALHSQAHGDKQPAAQPAPEAAEKPARPAYTPATVIRAAAEMRKLVEKREAMLLEAMKQVAAEWALAYEQMVTRQEGPEGPVTPDDALEAIQVFNWEPDSHAPPQ